MTFNTFQAELSRHERQPFIMLLDMDTSAERISFIRKGMGLTQDEFTEALNEVLKASGQPPVTRGAVGNWEREGGTGLAMRNLQALSELTGATIYSSFTGAGDVVPRVRRGPKR
jgi:transcriptional regulator with XRE-family HTH domain